MIEVELKCGDNLARIQLPAADGYLRSVLMFDLHAESSMVCRPVHVEQLEYPPQLSFISGKDVNLDELNYLAKRMDSFFGNEMNQFYAALQHEGFRHLKSLINLTFNLDKYTLITDVSNPLVIGKEYVLNTEGVIPADHSKDEEYIKIGKEIISGKRGELTEYGLMIIEDKPIEQVYDGKTFPLYDYYGSLLFVGLEYEGKIEGVSIAEDPDSIITAVDRLGAEKIEDCSLSILGQSTDLDPIMSKVNGILENESLLSLAMLCAKIYTKKPDIKKLNAVADYAGVHSSANLIKLIDNLDKFIYIDDAIDEEDVGHYFVDKFDDGQTYHVSIEMEEYVDFHAFGEHMMEEYSGKFIEGGAVCIAYYSDLDILEKMELEDEDQIIGGMSYD